MHGFEYQKGQGERDCDELSLHFRLSAVSLDGKLSSKELSLRLSSFARRLAVACLHRQPDLSQRNFGRTGGWSERGLSSRSTDIASLLTFSIRFSRLLCLDNTSLLVLGAHWAFRRGNAHSICIHCGALELDPECEGLDRRSWSWRACTDATVKCTCFFKAKFSRVYSTHGSWYTF